VEPLSDGAVVTVPQMRAFATGVLVVRERAFERAGDGRSSSRRNPLAVESGAD
jgi:hypothetical protein